MPFRLPLRYLGQREGRGTSENGKIQIKEESVAQIYPHAAQALGSSFYPRILFFFATKNQQVFGKHQLSQVLSGLDAQPSLKIFCVQRLHLPHVLAKCPPMGQPSRPTWGCQLCQGTVTATVGFLSTFWSPGSRSDGGWIPFFFSPNLPRHFHGQQGLVPRAHCPRV